MPLEITVAMPVCNGERLMGSLQTAQRQTPS